MFGTIEIVVLAGWAAMFALLIGYLVVMTVARGRVRRAGEPAAAPLADAAAVQAGLARMRAVDPAFDEQLLIDAGYTVAMLTFAALSVGDDAALQRITTASFWSAPFGRMLRSAAATRRRLNAELAKNGPAAASRARAHLAVDYQAEAPELAKIVLGQPQEVSVLISFSQLQAIVQDAAAKVATAAAAPNLAAMTGALAGAVASQAGAQREVEVSWLSGSGRYELRFERPAGSLTDPGAALASRTCRACGAGYRSEMAVACSSCGVPRPLPWGDWRLARAAPGAYPAAVVMKPRS